MLYAMLNIVTPESTKGPLMEQRHRNRIRVGYKATIIAGDVILEGVIENLSESGASVLIYSLSPLTGFSPETALRLKFEPAPGEILNLDCRIKWIDNLHSHGMKYIFGLEIIDPPWKDSSSFL